jgi:hypothetical protein
LLPVGRPPISNGDTGHERLYLLGSLHHLAEQEQVTLHTAVALRPRPALGVLHAAHGAPPDRPAAKQLGEIVSQLLDLPPKPSTRPQRVKNVYVAGRLRGVPRR